VLLDIRSGFIDADLFCRFRRRRFRQKVDFSISFFEARFDAVFMKTPNTLAFFLGLLAGSAKTVKIFASDHDCSPDGGFSGAAGRLYRIGVRRLDGFVFQTCFQKQLAAKNLHLNGRVIRNLFSPPPEVEAEKDIDVLWVGGFQSGKRPDRLLEVAKALPQHRFTVISKPCPPKQKPLEAELASLPNVEYVGTVPAHLINPFYARAKVFLCTSEVEGFPNTFLESWFNRAAVVSWQYTCDGVLDRHHAGIVGGDLAGCRNALNALLTGEESRAALAANGRRYVEEHHLKEKILPQYEDFIASLVGKKSEEPVN